MSEVDFQSFQILYHALTEPMGIVVTTNNPQKARAALYKARKQINDPELDDIHIRVSPNSSETEILLLRRSKITPTFNLSQNSNA